MIRFIRRKSKANLTLSPSGDSNGTTGANNHNSLPTHSVDPLLSPESQKQRSRIGRIRTLKIDRKFLIRVLLFSLFFWKRYALRRQAHRYLRRYMAWKADTVEGSFWRGTLPSHQWNTASSLQNLNMDLVISHCDLPVDWIFEWAKPVTFDKITIFSKCGKPVVGAPSNANIVVLPNLGRCDHSYAHFLLTHYQDYVKYGGDGSGDDNNDKFIIFTKDNDNMSREAISRHRSIGEMTTAAQSMGFACQEEQLWGYSPDHFLKICHPSAYMNWTAIAQYSRDSYVRLSRDDNSEFPSRNGKTLEDYVRNLNIPVPESGIAPMCFGGNFMFNAKYMVQHPKDLWERIEKSLSRGNNIAEGHYMERLWALLLSPPLSPEMVQEILNQQNSLCRIGVDPTGATGVLTKESRKKRKF